MDPGKKSTNRSEVSLLKSCRGETEPRVQTWPSPCTFKDRLLLEPTHCSLIASGPPQRNHLDSSTSSLWRHLVGGFLECHSSPNFCKLEKERNQIFQEVLQRGGPSGPRCTSCFGTVGDFCARVVCVPRSLYHVPLDWTAIPASGFLMGNG